MKYSRYIKGKRVVFVGACPNLRGRGLGKEIDAFDIVIKTNGSLFLKSKKYHGDYGKRLDVLYTNNQFYREMRMQLFAKLRDFRFLRMKSCHPHHMIKFNERIHAEIIRKSIAHVNKKIKCALMGAYIFHDIISQRPKELHLTGIDFFLSKKKVFEHDNYQEYVSGYLPDRIRNQGNLINEGKTEDGHNQLENTKFIYNLCKQNKNITMPDFIRETMVGIVKGKLKQR